jgi:outer membrane lipoprotein-sorting protein
VKALVSLTPLSLMVTLGMAGGPEEVSGQVRDPVAVLEEASQRYGALSGFCARFEQSMEVPLLRQTTNSEGSLCQAKPNLLAMRFSDPAGDVIVADGEFFWVYYPSSDPIQVIRFDMGSHPGGIDFHEEFLASPADRYTMDFVGEDAVNGAMAFVIDLTPRAQASFEQATVWIDVERWLIVKVRISMENESVRTVTLSDISLNPAEDPARFQFTPPAGTQVIRRD